MNIWPRLVDVYHFVCWTTLIFLVCGALGWLVVVCEDAEAAIRARRARREHEQRLAMIDRQVRQYCSEGPGSEPAPRRRIISQSNLAQQDRSLFDANPNAAHTDLLFTSRKELPPRAAGFERKKVQ